jgi:multimeric flavodoxin WrbA
VKILALLGSPRPAGNTRAVLDSVLEGARQAGAKTELIELSQLKNLSGCVECFTCQQTPDAPGCAVDDDMQEVLAKALTADVVVLATPVFCWSMSWLLKAALDRFYCMFKFGEEDVRCLLEGRGLAGVITAGGGEEDGADAVTECFQRLAQFSQCHWLGAFIAANATVPEELRADEDLRSGAREFGQTLISQ